MESPEKAERVWALYEWARQHLPRNDPVRRNIASGALALFPARYYRDKERRRRESHRDSVNEAKRRWYAANRAETLERNRAYRLAHLEEDRERSRQWKRRQSAEYQEERERAILRRQLRSSIPAEYRLTK